MYKVKEIYESFIMIFSEIIWIYYLIVLFTSDEWGQSAFFNFTWFIIAGLIGYVINAILSRRKSNILLFSANILVIGLLVVQNWRNVVPQGHLAFGVAVSIGIVFLFLRSSRLFYHIPSRQEILYHFEGNVMFYIVFAVFFTFRGWANNTLHLLFVFLIISSLFGMIFTLQNHEKSENNKNVKIIKVGKSGWFTGVMTSLLILIPLFSLLFLLPSVNKTVHALGKGAWEVLKRIMTLGLDILMWFFSLLPVPNQEIIDVPLDSGLIPSLEGSELEAVSNTIPFLWIITVIVILIILITVWFIVRFRIKRSSYSPAKVKYLVVTRESWWKNFKERIKKYLHLINLKWRMHFQRFFKHPIYWYYYQIAKWGKKNHIIKEDNETSQEYINKVIMNISEENTSFINKDHNYNLPELLKKLNNDYQATYYGNQTEMSYEEDYKLLIDYLRKRGRKLLKESL